MLFRSSLVPDFEERYTETMGPEIAAAVSSYATWVDLEMRNRKDGRYATWFSGRTSRDLMRYVGGWNVNLASFLLLSEVRLPPRIARSQLFRISLNRAGDVLTFLNAIVGLHRDIRLKQIDSPITIAVHYEGVSLQEAWNSTLRRLHDLRRDYQLANALLRSSFGEEDAEAVENYIRVVNTFMDGTLFAYTKTDRYGNIHQMKIVE